MLVHLTLRRTSGLQSYDAPSRGGPDDATRILYARCKQRSMSTFEALEQFCAATRFCELYTTARHFCRTPSAQARREQNQSPKRCVRSPQILARLRTRAAAAPQHHHYRKSCASHINYSATLSQSSPTSKLHGRAPLRGASCAGSGQRPVGNFARGQVEGLRLPRKLGRITRTSAEAR